MAFGLRGRAVLAAGLLVSFGLQAAYAASPLFASRCVCDHGPEVDCDCPHHEGKALPACHRKHAPHATAKTTTGRSLRARCGASTPSLELLTLVLLERTAAPGAVAPTRARWSLPRTAMPGCSLAPPTPPPKSRG